jgi:hypothetical protein
MWYQAVPTLAVNRFSFGSVPFPTYRVVPLLAKRLANPFYMHRPSLGLRISSAGLCLSLVAAAATWARTPAWDDTRYIDIHEIKAGQEATCLTVYQGTAVERFALDVVDVIRDYQPGHDAILVQGRDERFVHTGPVAGCSGSPVYIEGRLAGALAFGWPLSKDPLYGVTPIREMLAIVEQPGEPQAAPAIGHGRTIHWDYREPLDIQKIGGLLFDSSPRPRAARENTLECPLLCSGLGIQAQTYVEGVFQPYGFLPVTGTGNGQDAMGATSALAPGSVLMVPLVDGDIRMAVLGTVTEVTGGHVFGFGHSFLGQGPLHLPLATGRVHTVVSNLSQSFKLGSSIETVGALTQDAVTGVVGIVGDEAPTLPVRLRIDHYLHAQTVHYACQVARHLELTPELLKAVVGGSVMSFGTLPVDHILTYEGHIQLGNGQAIRLANFSAGTNIRELLMELLGSVALLMNNPFREIEIQAIDLSMRIQPINGLSFITALDIPDRRVEAGDTLRVMVTLETFRAGKQRHAFTLTVPEDTRPGKYELSVGGFLEYERVIRRRAPYRLMAHDVPSLIEALNFSLSLNRSRLYCLLELPGSGYALERQEMPGLPGTRALVLRSSKQTVHMTPYQPWLERSLKLDTVTANGQRVSIEVK